MLDKKLLIPLTLLISVGIAVYDFFLFSRVELIFYLHTFATFVMGLSLFYFPYRLIKQKVGNIIINILVMILGLMQITIHLVVLFIGRC